MNHFIINKQYDKIWSKLKVISCWCDANASSYSKRLQDIFPNAIMQPKGLLATECFVSFPFVGESAARLSLHSHFFEFISVSNHQTYFAHQLKEKETYEVVVTTSGGLYRYQLHDIIKVVGFAGEIPLIQFMGRGNKVSDLFGEKITEQFIINLFENLEMNFYMVAPKDDHYVLYTNSINTSVDYDELLRGNFHYHYCRELGQLKQLRIFQLTGNPQQEYIDYCMKNGQRLGDIKPTALHLNRNWDTIFTGEYI